MADPRDRQLKRALKRLDVLRANEFLSATLTQAAKGAALALLMSGPGFSLTITPSRPPVVLQGQTFQFQADQAVTWSLVPGSAGTIDADGTYHAPSRVTVNTSADGCQLLPPDHGYFARVDTLPVRPESAAWVNLLTSMGRPMTLNSHDTPINVLTPATPSQNFTFSYTSGNNGSYQVPPIPDLLLQSGNYYTTGDRHYFGIRPDTCQIIEIYNWSANPPGYAIYPVSSSGLTYSAMTGTVPQTATNAAGTYMVPNVLRAQEVMKALATGASTIGHPIQFSLSNGLQLGGLPEWPATTSAVNEPNLIPYGARFRLKSSYTYSGSNPVTALLLNSLKQYGFLVSDGGFSMDSYSLDSDYVPPAMAQSLAEIASLGVGFLNNFEAVKESVLAPADPTAPDGGLIDPAKAGAINGFLRPQFAQVVATNGSGQTATMHVLLQGSAIDFEQSAYPFQAGAAAFRLPYHMSGFSNTAVTCTMSSPVGTLDAGTCTYTPPSTLASPTSTLVTVVSNEDPTRKTQTLVIVLPDGPLHLLTAAPSDFTDSVGQKWWTISPNSNFPVAIFATGPVSSVPYQDAPTSVTDWQVVGYGYHPRGDQGIDLHVPPGNYKVTLKYLSTSNHQFLYLDTQDQTIYPYLDTNAIAGGAVNQVVSLDMPAIVGSDGRLRVYSRRVDGYGVPPVPGADTSSYFPNVSFQLDPSAVPHITINPTVVPLPITAGQTQTFTCVGWYMANTCTWTASAGTIDANGVYTAPSTPPSADTTITITATSTADPSKTAQATATFTFGSIHVSPSASSTDRQMTTSFAADINGVAYPHVRWSVQPAIGTIDPTTGLYTAPNTLAADTTVTVTATSTDDATHTGSTTLLVRALPLPIYVGGGIEYPYYMVDSHNIKWVDDEADFTCTGGQCYPGASADHSQPVAAVSATYPPLEEVSATTKLLWDGMKRGSVYYPPPQNDFTYSFPLPNGTYQLALGFNQPSTIVPQAGWSGMTQDVTVNGSTWLHNWDTLTNCGLNVACSPPALNVTVSDGHLTLLFHGTNTSILNGTANLSDAPGVTFIRIVPTASTVSGPPAPVITPNGGTYVNSQSVSIADAQQNVSVYYTLNGTAPTSSSTPYRGPFTITADTVVNAIAVSGTVSSNVTSATFHITPLTSAGVLSVKPYAATFNMTLGGAAPANQTLQLSNTGGQSLSWTVGGFVSRWLSASPTAGSLTAGGSASLTLSVNPSGLTAGVYSDAVTVTAPGATGSPATVAVTLTIAPPNVPLISIAPSQIVRTLSDTSSAVDPQTLTLTNSGGTAAAWYAVASDPWIHLSMTGGTLPARQSNSSTISFSPTGLSPGIYQAVVIIVAPTAYVPYQILSIELDASSLGGAASVAVGGASAARVYPNPWRNDRNPSKHITFDQMAGGASVRLYSLSGHLVKTLTADASGKTVWDLTADNGSQVASGLYLYVVKDSKGTTQGKLAIIH